jgi:drug/metabolite transporter (DMT)-like permease
MTKVRPDRYNVIAAFLCVIGIGLVALRGDSFSAGQSLVATGDLLTLISGVLYAIHIVAIAKFTEGKDVILLTIIQFCFYTAIAWVMSLFFEKMPSSIGLADGASLLYLGGVCYGDCPSFPEHRAEVYAGVPGIDYPVARRRLRCHPVGIAL